MSQYVGGYAIGDVTGDGVPDLANVGTFGESSGSAVVRTPAIFVKPGRGDGTFEPLRIWRLPTGKLGVKQNLGSGFFVAPVTNTQRADVVFADDLADGHVDIVQSR